MVYENDVCVLDAFHQNPKNSQTFRWVAEVENLIKVDETGGKWKLRVWNVVCPSIQLATSFWRNPISGVPIFRPSKKWGVFFSIFQLSLKVGAIDWKSKIDTIWLSRHRPIAIFEKSKFSKIPIFWAFFQNLTKIYTTFVIWMNNSKKRLKQV